MIMRKAIYVPIKTLISKATALGLAAALFLITSGMLAGCGSSSQDNNPVQGPIIDGEEGYHVIIAGGEPEGVAAALSAARNGVRALLVEESDALGGLMTLGMLNFLDQNHGPEGELLTRGIFLEFYESLGNAFDIDEAKEWFLEKCNDEPNLTVMLNTEIVAPVLVGNTISGLEIMQKGASAPQVIRSLTVIDATADGDIAAAAGAPYTVGGEDRGAHGYKQGVTLVFEVSGVDWSVLANHINNDGNPNTGVSGNAAWGYNEEVRDFTPTDSNMRYRAPNIARLTNGNLLLNGLIIFGVDAHDPDSYAEGIARGQREIPHIIEYMRRNFPGFENAVFVQHAPRLYVRETRHFIGEYRLTITDVLENRDHWDRIGHGSYPVDVQATSPGETGNVIGVPDIYSIPFRCLIPLEIDQLLITSRSASYDSLPHGSTRVIPVGMVSGEAGGAAVAYIVEHGVTFRQMGHDTDAIQWLQNRLISQGAYLVEYEPPRVAVMDHWAYPGMAVMREFGMAAGGYTNDYRLDAEVPSRWALQNRINDMMKIINERTAYRGQNRVPIWEANLDSDVVTVSQLLLTVAQCASRGEIFTDANDTDANEVESYLIERGILSNSILPHFSDPDAIATYGHVLSVLGSLYTVLMES